MGLPALALGTFEVASKRSGGNAMQTHVTRTALLNRATKNNVFVYDVADSVGVHPGRRRVGGGRHPPYKEGLPRRS